MEVKYGRKWITIKVETSPIRCQPCAAAVSSLNRDPLLEPNEVIIIRPDIDIANCVTHYHIDRLTRAECRKMRDVV